MHEAEISNLEQLREERGPILSLVDKHRSLLEDQEQLVISSNDANRLMQRGGARDPTRLLREEKMRKRIAKDLPKVEAELRAALEQWEEENGTPFTVKGEDYLEVLPVVNKPPPRSRSRGPPGASGAPNLKPPSTPGPQTRGSRSQSVRESRMDPRPILKHSTSVASATSNVSRSNAARPKTPGAPNAGNRTDTEGRPKTSHANRPKTPTTSTVRGNPSYTTLSKTPSRNSRPGLNSINQEPSSTNGSTSNTSDTRSLTSYKSVGSMRRKMQPPPTPTAPPKMSKLTNTPPSSSGARRGDSMHSRTSQEGSVTNSIRCISPPEPSTPGSGTYHNRAYLRNGASTYRSREGDSVGEEGMLQSPKQQLHPRAFSGTSSESSSTVVSSENWETFEDSDHDEDLRAMYYQKLRMDNGGKSPTSPMGYGGYRSFGDIHTNSSIAIVGDDEWDDHERS